MKIIKDIAKAIKKSNKIALFHHQYPDGDTFSSSYGLMKALQLKFPDKEIKWVADIEAMKERLPFMVKDYDDVIEDIDSSWTAIIGDCAGIERIHAGDVYKKAGFKICFDHHQNDINFEHDLYWKQDDLGASSVQAYLIAKELKVDFDAHSALSLIFGILTDTFNFTYSLNDVRPVEAAADLMKYIDRDEMDNMYKELRKRTQDDIKFQAFALNGFKIEDRIAYLKITESDLQQLKLKLSDVARVNTIGNIEGVDVWMFLIEDVQDDMIKISMRSLGFPVNELANKFGGGGHIRAAGVKLPRDWAKADKLIETAKKEVKKYFK